MGFDGLGLYALDPKKGRLHKDEHGLPIAGSSVVFPRSTKIDVFGGERVRIQTMNERYGEGDDETASYAIAIDNVYFVDPLAAATALAYANDPINVGNLMRDNNTIESFKRAYTAATRNNPHKNVTWGRKSAVGEKAFMSTRPIHNGEEILWFYGWEYWSTEGTRRHLGFGAWEPEPKKRRRH